MSVNLLDKEEKEVYKFVKEYLNKKVFSSIEEIINFLNYRLRKNPNFTSYRIESILKSLIKKKFIILGSKLVKENILELPKRKKIYTHIINNPGININEIIRALNIGSNHALWHLKFLEKFQFVRSTRINNQKIFFKFTSNSEYDKVIFYLRNEKIRRIIDLIEKSTHPLKLTEISTKLKIHYNTIKKYLEILKNLDLIIISIENRSELFRLDQENYYKTLNELKIVK